ncbi:hypothetical protein GCM10023238_37440 [Streptomyces heliomycini]
MGSRAGGAYAPACPCLAGDKPSPAGGGAPPSPGGQRKTFVRVVQPDGSDTAGVRPGRVRDWYIASISSA